MGSNIILNLFIGIILENFSYTFETSTFSIDKKDLIEFQRLWQNFDPNAFGYINIDKYAKFVIHLFNNDSRFGLDLTNSTERDIFLVTKFELLSGVKFPKEEASRYTLFRKINFLKLIQDFIPYNSNRLKSTRHLITFNDVLLVLARAHVDQEAMTPSLLENRTSILSEALFQIKTIKAQHMLFQSIQRFKYGKMIERLRSNIRDKHNERDKFYHPEFVNEVVQEPEKLSWKDKILLRLNLKKAKPQENNASLSNLMHEKLNINVFKGDNSDVNDWIDEYRERIKRIPNGNSSDSDTEEIPTMKSDSLHVRSYHLRANSPQSPLRKGISPSFPVRNQHLAPVQIKNSQRHPSKNLDVNENEGTTTINPHKFHNLKIDTSFVDEHKYEPLNDEEINLLLGPQSQNSNQKVPNAQQHHREYHAPSQYGNSPPLPPYENNKVQHHQLPHPHYDNDLPKDREYDDISTIFSGGPNRVSTVRKANNLLAEIKEMTSQHIHPNHEYHHLITSVETPTATSPTKIEKKKNTKKRKLKKKMKSVAKSRPKTITPASRKKKKVVKSTKSKKKQPKPVVLPSPNTLSPEIVATGGASPSFNHSPPQQYYQYPTQQSPHYYYPQQNPDEAHRRYRRTSRGSSRGRRSSRTRHHYRYRDERHSVQDNSPDVPENIVQPVPFYMGYDQHGNIVKSFNPPDQKK